MKRMMILAVTGAIGLTAHVRAQNTPTSQPTTAPTTQASATPVNKKCPVSGDPVDPKVQTVVYQGKTIGFCCADCVEPFKKNPEKYSKNIK